MRVGQRLFLAVTPAILGVFTVAGLAYWGAFHRAAPEWVVAVAAVSAVGSLVLAWQNTRYVARRIERLAGTRAKAAEHSPLGVVRSVALPKTASSPDEIDSIEQVVDHLNSAVSVAQAGGEQRERAADERMQEYALLLDEGSTAVRRQLDEARLALHILLEHHFGTLNDSQDEMLTAARAAMDAAEREMARMQDIARLDRGAPHTRRDSIRVADLLRGLRPQLEAEGTKHGVTVTLDLQPGLRAVVGDRIRLQQALELLLLHLVRHATPGQALSMTAENETGSVRVSVLNGRAPTLDADVGLARRIIEAHGGRIDVAEDRTSVMLPSGPR